MWWFLGRSKQSVRTSTTDPAPGWGGGSNRIRSEQELLALVPDLSSLAAHDVAVKIWLPEVVASTLKWVADYHGVSQSSWVRERLIEYVYGHAARLAYEIQQSEDRDSVRFSRGSSPIEEPERDVYKLPQLGKNAVAFKLELSSQLRADLLVLSEHAGVKLSPFLRELIIGELLGRGSLPERAAILGEPGDAALAWERDETDQGHAPDDPHIDGVGEGRSPPNITDSGRAPSQ